MKAPLYSHFTESLTGLITIRAFGWKTAYKTKTLQLILDSQKPYYLLLCVQQWLGLVLNLVVSVLAILLVGLAVALRDTASPALMGVALVMMISLGQTITGLVQSWTNLETSLGAVARVKAFQEETPIEKTLQRNTINPSHSWPPQGGIEFENVSVKYEETSEPVLRDITLSIKPGKKVGLCGRTGRYVPPHP